MILRNFSSFQQGERIRIVIPEINLEHEADEVYPNNAIGIVVLPYFKDKNGEVNFDEQKFLALQDERLVFVALDESSNAIAVPDQFLKKLKPEDEEY